MAKISIIMAKIYDIKKIDDITPDHYIWEDKCHICEEWTTVCSGTGCCKRCDDNGKNLL